MKEKPGQTDNVQKVEEHISSTWIQDALQAARDLIEEDLQTPEWQARLQSALETFEWVLANDVNKAHHRAAVAAMVPCSFSFWLV